jgi:hypothetical protein
MPDKQVSSNSVCRIQPGQHIHVHVHCICTCMYMERGTINCRSYYLMLIFDIVSTNKSYLTMTDLLYIYIKISTYGTLCQAASKLICSVIRDLYQYAPDRSVVALILLCIITCMCTCMYCTCHLCAHLQRSAIQ